MNINETMKPPQIGGSELNDGLCTFSGIALSIQDAVRIMELVQCGNFSIEAMKDGRYQAFEKFQAVIRNKIKNGDFDDVYFCA
jgi:hypothetical protein